MMPTALPGSAGTGGHDGTAEALVLIDLQEDFFAEPALAARRSDVVRATLDLAARARTAGAPVIGVRTEHGRDRLSWSLAMREDDVGIALSGTPGARWLEELRTLRLVEVVKSRDSAFHLTVLEDQLRSCGATSFVLAGVATERCVAMTAADGYARDFRVTIAVDAVATGSLADHRPTLERLARQYRQPSVHNHLVRFVAPRGNGT